MKTKVNLKLAIALIVMLLAVVFNMNTVNATTDEEYVKSLALTSPKYYEVDLDFLKSDDLYNDFMKMIGDYYTNLINDSSIVVEASSETGGAEGGLNMWTFETGTEIQIFKNGILCDTRTMGKEFTVPVINVPSTVTDTELNTYLTDLITESYPEFGEGITKIEKGTKEVEGIDITDGYTVISDYGMESYIIVKKEVADVNIKNDTTNIKLEADTTVVPENTVLETKEVKEEKTLNIVKESLKEISTKYTTYDITLKSEGVAIQPNGKVKISIPIPSAYDKTKLSVYRVAEDGTKTEYDTTVDGNYAVIETDHFSTYVLAEKSVVNTEVPKTEETPKVDDTQTEVTPPKADKDDTPKTGTIETIYYILPVMILATVGVITLKKKSSK